MIDVFLRERHAKKTEDENTDTQRRRPCDTDWNDVATNQGSQGMLEETRKESPLELWRD